MVVTNADTRKYNFSKCISKNIFTFEVWLSLTALLKALPIILFTQDFPFPLTDIL